MPKTTILRPKSGKRSDQAGAAKKVVKPAQKRSLSNELIEKGLSCGQACGIVRLSGRMYTYQPISKQDQPVEQAIKEVLKKHPSWDSGKCFIG